MVPSLATLMPDAETVRRRTAWICELFHRAGLGRLFLLQQRKRGRIPILVYHSVQDIPERTGPESCFMAMGMVVEKNRFEAQMGYLSQYATVVGLEEVAASLSCRKPLPPDAVAITFDDGFRDNFTIVAPILRKYGFKAAFFPIGSSITSSGSPWPHGLYRILDEMESKPFRIDIPGFPRISGNRLGASEKLRLARRLRLILEALQAGEREAAIRRISDAHGFSPGIAGCAGLFMTDAELRLLAREGHTIGAHTMNHCRLTGLSAREAAEEIKLSRECIATFGASGFTAFAYPYGSHDSIVRHVVQQQGFTCALTTAEGLNDRKTDPFALQRIYIGNFGIAEFETHLSGAAAFLLRLARKYY